MFNILSWTTNQVAGDATVEKQDTEGRENVQS